MRFVEKVVSALARVVLLAVAIGCVHPLDDPDGNGGVKTSLALSLKNVGVDDPQTKMTAAITQSACTFRGIEGIYIFPFTIVGDGPVTSGKSCMTSPFGFLYSGFDALMSTNNSHLYTVALVPGNTNRVVVYGKAVDSRGGSTVVFNRRNGVLTPSGLDNPTTSDDISFSLECILDNAALLSYNGLITDILDALNGVATALQTYSNISAIQDLLTLVSRGNQILGCSYQTFYNIQQEILNALIVIGNNQSGPEIEEALTVIGDAMDPYAVALSALRNASVSSLIPEGAVGFWWNGKQFVRLINGVNIALVDPGSYCYPPSLWYYANSKVKTSRESAVTELYTESNTWGTILAGYEGGGTVFSDTRAVAVNDQLQYGVGLMDLSVTAAASNNDEIVAALGCPLTGVIYGSQRDVDFSFTPQSSSSVRFVYDTVIETDDQHPNALSTTTAVEIETLLLPTLPSLGENDKFYFALEFQNTTNSTLQCQQGDILPRCKFYLVGELDISDGVQPQNETLSSIIVRDRKTVVEAVAVSLKKAYNTVPDLRSPQLEIGILAEMKWTQITPESVKLNL